MMMRQHRGTAMIFMAAVLSQYVVFGTKIRCATFNMGNAPLDTDELDSWLPRDEEVDLYVVGVQEAKYKLSDLLPIEKMMYGNVKDHLVGTVTNHLAAGFRLVTSVGMYNQMMLFVFVRKDRYSDVTIQRTRRKRGGSTGIHKVRRYIPKWGEHKGACVIALQLGEEKFCFVNAHLPAHMKGVNDRNSNFVDIHNELNEKIFKKEGNSQFAELTREEYGIFWMGDLNYRINHSTYSNSKEVTNVERKAHNDDILLARSGKAEVTATEVLEYHVIKENDQLTRVLGNEHLVFSQYRENSELLYNFLPTFKVARGIADTVYQNHRSASWCDRVLVSRDNNNHTITYDNYTSHPKVSTSDHKPVSAVLEFVSKSRNILKIPKFEVYRAQVIQRLSQGVPVPVTPRTAPRSRTVSLRLERSESQATMGQLWQVLESVNMECPSRNQEILPSEQSLSLEVYDSSSELSSSSDDSDSSNDRSDFFDKDRALREHPLPELNDKPTGGSFI